ncbi:phage virion morphogenesis protein [Actinobacillus equuli]|uniref:phage virion morphogenesis protein n=1 Tax=Actinobacillus equuli TaxID=718 RepID=UPI002442B3F3|nr:phage virion morphogenesis protein [Actinobacillus equuli]WGE76086.1 phage virion morphogenesis protein [Actinobacillus equuli subsp. haemolyticus]WGE78043.1 phage virion morphogenesis protein [Actinobacillus equuli subsp. haemolyticus]
MATADELQLKFDALIARLTPNGRKALTKEIAKRLAQSQRQRIKAQKNSDGSEFEPRRKQPKQTTKRRVKAKKMFAKLGTARLMKAQITTEGVEIGYRGGDAVVAGVHQFGRKIRPFKGKSFAVTYAKRELLGFTDEDIEMIEDCVINVLSDGL